MKLYNSNENKYQKLLISLKYYLVGKGYHKALSAMAFAQKHHSGTRKDGFTPEFQHQVEIALHISTLKDLVDEETTLIVAFLHDIVEDTNVSVEDINRMFGKIVADSVYCMTKKTKDFKKSTEQYMFDLQNDAFASIVKGVDRHNNFGSMLGVFSKEKQETYIKEGIDLFLPMLKNASNNFPSQHSAYMNIRSSLKMQIHLISATFV